MHNSLFPGSRLSGSVGSLTTDGAGGDAAGDAAGDDHQQYLRELERIRTEIAGFQPIEQPMGERLRGLNGKSSSHDDDPFTGDDYY